MAYRIVNEIDVPSSPPLTNQASSPTQSRKGDTTSSSLRSGGNGGTGKKMDEDEERDAVFYRLELLGYRVGQGLVERYSIPSPLPFPFQISV